MTPAIFRLFTTISPRAMIRYGNPTCLNDVFYLYSIGASNMETIQRAIYLIYFFKRDDPLT